MLYYACCAIVTYYSTYHTIFVCYTTSTMPYCGYYDILSCSAYCGILCLLCHNKSNYMPYNDVVLCLLSYSALCGILCQLCHNQHTRGGVEDTRLEVKAKNTKKFRSQGQGQTLSRPRPRTKDTGASVLQKKGFQKIFSSNLKKRSSKIFFRQKKSSKAFFWRFPLEENKKGLR